MTLREVFALLPQSVDKAYEDLTLEMANMSYM
jgi:hypothetical protein